VASKRPDGTDLLDFWQAALGLEVGLSIKSTDRKLLQQQLYRARQESGIVALQDLCISYPDKEGELWILHKEVLENA
jgi:hypothetical protein